MKNQNTLKQATLYPLYCDCDGLNPNFRGFERLCEDGHLDELSAINEYLESVHGRAVTATERNDAANELAELLDLPQPQQIETNPFCDIDGLTQAEADALLDAAQTQGSYDQAQWQDHGDDMGITYSLCDIYVSGFASTEDYLAHKKGKEAYDAMSLEDRNAIDRKAFTKHGNLQITYIDRVFSADETAAILEVLASNQFADDSQLRDIVSMFGRNGNQDQLIDLGNSL